MDAPGHPLRYLPADEHVPHRLSRYMFTSCLVAYVYDWLLSISEECEILSKSGMTPSNALYLVSRIGALGLVLTSALYVLAPISDCQALVEALGTCSTVVMLSTSFLFLQRVRAVYLQSTAITVIFGALWLVTAGLAILQASCLRAVHILNTQHCIATSREYLALPSIVTCINDTLVFLAISFRLTADAATERTWRARAQSIFQGKGLYSLSRSLMKSGQTYYLASIIFFIISLVVMFSPTVPAASHYLLTPGYLAFTNIMACHIFRGVALGMMEGPSGLTTTKIAAALQTDPRINKEPSGDVQVS
ncbi:hypothetical protein FIBSPDRAFT_949901 [Athelia psychrophila]|uniref:DUF6533 domain-containing protein n=1 Tax=Athelia psychrophila TaxID=1759441 RepID=A0A166P757_9AGAM|nr:hypothetical protein FIBSPDRAFT_949901 [Fibularhizoctonia sp. CBS 109695]